MTRPPGPPDPLDDAGVLRWLDAAFPVWHLRDDRLPGPPTELVARDDRLGDAVARGEAPPTFRLWENGKALVVTRREARLPRFQEASRSMAEEGWPAVVRDSGGTAVPHAPGILQVSLVLPHPGVPHLSVETGYAALCAPVRTALRSIGVEAAYGNVPGSFCDGRFNLVAGGGKLAGTSQRWRAAVAPGMGGYVLAHMSLFVEASMAAATRAVNRFQELAGSPDRFDPAAHTTVRERLAERPGSERHGSLTDAVRETLLATLAESLGGVRSE